MHPNPRRRAFLSVVKPLGAYLLWNIAAWNLVVGAMAAGWTILGLAGAVLLFGWFLREYVLRSGRPAEVRRWALLRLRPLSLDAALATTAAIPVLLALSWSVGEVWTRLVPVPPETFRPFQSLTATPEGRLTVVVFALVVAPILEEFIFRGMVQHPLERRWGPARAIGLTGLVFALFHALPWVLPIHLVLGLAFGYAVYATRSIWAGVVLHAANNSFAALGVGAEPPQLPETVWKTGPTPDFWTALAVLAASSILARAVAAWLWRAGRPGRIAESFAEAPLR